MMAAEWAARLIGLAGDVEPPRYGSPEFEAAPVAVQLASAARAAEAWRAECDPHVIAARLELELEAARRRDERDYDGWREVAGRVRQMADAPSHAELLERRAA